ncbi:unnamed protein product [marine sediment metagenome]|uniref:Uncharacterized protein n=1 Tax=marine sediment metagenome TaxID=412755 RepID=X0ZMX6_9ZZZZ
MEYYHREFLKLPIPYRNVLGSKNISKIVFKNLWMCEECNKFVDTQDTTYICDDRVGQMFICSSCNPIDKSD